MDRHPHTPSGFSMSMLIDEDIAHIGRVMPASMHGDSGGAILPAAYWRERLNPLLAHDHLSKPQRCAIDGLLLQLEHLDASRLEPPPFMGAPLNNRASPAAAANIAANATSTGARPPVRRATRAARPRRPR
jgi:hypothetical protein